MSLDSDIERRASIDGYSAAHEISQKLARAFQIAQIFVAAVDVDRLNSTTICIDQALRDASLMREGETIADLQTEALGAIRQRAESEQRMADDAGHIIDRLT